MTAAAGDARLGAARPFWALDAGLRRRLGSIPSAVVLAPLLVMLGVAILTWDFAQPAISPQDHVLYWLGLGVAYAGVVALGAAGRPSPSRQAVALGVLGAVSWLPYYLRSPDRLIFVDELFHRDILSRVLETGHATGQPVTLFALPGTFPGLEAATTGVIAMTGVSMDEAIRVVTLAIHTAIPVVAYLVALGVGLHVRGAFLAALVYAANTSFPFFHAVFSYESLGILLFLSVFALVALALRAGDRRRAASVGRGREADPAEGASRETAMLVPLSIPLLAGIAVTHHISSYILVAALAVTWLVARLRHAWSTRALAAMAVLAFVFAALWFAVSAERIWSYLANSLVARIVTIVGTLIQGTGPRPLFANADQPALERALAFSYPPLILLLTVLGLWLAWRNHVRSVLWVSLALIGPLAWLLTTPAVVTRSGELAYRAWPFLFLGVAVFAALALLEIARRADRWRIGLGLPLAFVIVGAVLFGGISIGGNQTGRFATAPTTAAGGATYTTDVVEAARWLLATAGPNNVVATDSGTAVAFAVDGRQRILGWAGWYPFVIGDPDEIANFVRETGTRYLVIDWRVTELPPRYNSYYGAPPIREDLDPGAPIPADRLEALDDVRGLDRVYIGPNIVIYRVGPSLVGGGAG